MNNNDFQRLLTTNDRELVQQLTQRKKSGGGATGRGGKGQGKGKDDKAIARIARAAKYKQKALAKEEKDAEENKYRDRASLRRDMKGEYEKVAAEFENHGEVSVEQSKYLGGDLEHTHLVKGLDFALLNKVRAELNKQKKVEEVQKAKQQQRKPGEKAGRRTFENRIAKNVWLTVVETLHPHHSTFKERVQKMGKAIAQGHRIRNAPTMFLPGRMAYEFDTELEMGKTDIPRIVYMSKEEVAPSERGKSTSGMLPETAVRVRDAMQKAAEVKKLRKQKLAPGVGTGYAMQKVDTPKVQARDSDNDIFSGAGTFDANEFVQKARAEQAAKRQKEGIKEEKVEVKKEEVKEEKKARKASYFDDAGDEKYRQAPERQLDLDEIEVEESTLEPGQFHKPTGRFEAAKRFKGARKNWVFKLGDLGLGYYEEVPPRKKVEEPSAVEKDPRKRKAPRAASSSGPQGMGNPGNDAYDELFPNAMMGGAMMTTHSDDSDDDDDKKKKDKDKDKKKGDKKKINEDSVAANKKSAAAEAKKRKMSENQQWQKIDNMIKKGKVSSMESMEQQASKKTGKTSHLATPAFF